MMEEKIKLEGTLSEISAPQVFHALSVSKGTGIFDWQLAGRQKKVYISKGQIVFAVSNQRTERLGEVLLRTGQIRVKEFLDAAGRITPKKRLGQVLIEMGALKKEDIRNGVIEQVREILFGLFNESDGAYTFQEQQELPKEVITLNINTEELVLRGTQCITDWSLILQTLSGINTIFEPAAGARKKTAQLHLTDSETNILKLVTGEHSAASICERAAGNDFETCRTLMALLCANLIRPITDSEIALVDEKRDIHYFDRTMALYNQLFSYIYRYLGEKVGRLGDKNLSHYLEEIKGDYPTLFKGIFFLPDGTLAAEVLRENFEKLPSETHKKDLLDGLKALLSAELAATRESLGSTEEAFVASRLKGIVEGLKKPAP
jgi:hypothetical protein